jgi:hypothetical protein
VYPVLFDSHRVRSPSLDFGTSASDLPIPRLCGVGLGFGVKTANQFERQAGALFGGKTKDLGEHVGWRHDLSLAAAKPPASRYGLSVICQSISVRPFTSTHFLNEFWTIDDCDPLAVDQTAIQRMSGP